MTTNTNTFKNLSCCGFSQYSISKDGTIIKNGFDTTTVDGVSYPLSRGSVIGWRAGMTYSYQPNEEGMVLIGCNYDLTQSARQNSVPVPPCNWRDFTADKFLEDNVQIDDAAALSGAFCLNAGGDIVEKMNLINLEYSRHMLFSTERCNSLFKDVLVQCARLMQTADGDMGCKIAERVIGYVGAHLGLGWYNFALGGEFRIQDHKGRTPAYGGGLGLGYAMNFKKNPRWGMEFALGGGVYKAKYDVFFNENNGPYEDTAVEKVFFGLDNVSVAFTYRFNIRKEGRR